MADKPLVHNTIVSAMLVAALFFMSAHGAGAAKSSAPKKIGLDDAIGIAFRNNHDYRIAVKRLRMTREQVNAVWGQLWPVLESEASMLRQHAENGAQSLTDGQNDIRFVQLKFGINPGMFYHSLQLSRKNQDAAGQELRRIKSEIRYNVIRSYFAMLLAEEMVKLRADSVQYLRENLKDVSNLYKTGSVPRVELLQARVKVMNAEPLLAAAKNDFLVSGDSFNYYLGVDGSLYAADNTILDRRVSTPKSDREDRVRALTELALLNRPELIQLKLKRQIASHARNIQSSLYLWPLFSVAGGYGLTQNLANAATVNITTPFGNVEPDLSRITGNRDWQTTWQVRIAATYRWGSLFPGDSSRSREREEKIRMTEAQEEMIRLKKGIGIAIRSNYSRLCTAAEIIGSQRESIATARESLRIARESYRAGVIRNTDLLSAEVMLADSRAAYINAVNGYYLSLAELQKETGIDDEKKLLGATK